MTQIDDLIARIGALMARRERAGPVLVAIDGHSAAGKSTFARALATAWPHAALVETDDFYRVMDADTRFMLDAAGGYEAYYDWQRLRDEVLQPLRAGEVARYRIYDWADNRLGAWREAKAIELVIVEGCYSARPEIAALFDFIVLVKTDAARRAHRQQARDDASAAWLARWEAAERHYIESTRLAERANMVVAGQ